MNKKYFSNSEELFWIIIFAIIICFIFFTFGCSSITIAADKKCRNTNIAGSSWANNDLSTVLTFNDDCSGVVQQCQAYFTYEQVDFNKVYLNVSYIQDKPECPKVIGVHKCVYTITHLPDIHTEVMDVRCDWTMGYEQVTRYEE